MDHPKTALYMKWLDCWLCNAMSIYIQLRPNAIIVSKTCANKGHN